MTTAPQAIAGNCEELTTLAPRLAPALRRDNTTSGRYGRLEATLAPVNTDVLAVMITLAHEIPAAAIRAAELLNETWPRRPIATCLRAIPVFAWRMQALAMTSDVHHLELLTRAWVRQAKRALGLRRPDIDLRTPCPACETEPAGTLQVAGAEGFLRPAHGGVTVEWIHDPRVYCTRCGTGWGQAEWDHLILVIQQHAERAATAIHQQPVVACLAPRTTAMPAGRHHELPWLTSRRCARHAISKVSACARQRNGQALPQLT